LRCLARRQPAVCCSPHAELAAEAAEATAHARSIGLDMNRFNAEMADRIYTQRIQEHRRAGERSGVRATPTFMNRSERAV